MQNTPLNFKSIHTLSDLNDSGKVACVIFTVIIDVVHANK